MEADLLALLSTAVTLGFLHTVLGPDHYLPFIVLSRASSWSTGRTLAITFLCGVAHVGSSIVLGCLGLAAGVSVAQLQGIEGARGAVAAWILIAFGLVYFIWGAKQALRGKTHKHHHFHLDGTLHDHNHRHESGHLHLHRGKNRSLTPWVLFTIFVFGPCEVLIPVLLYPAAKLDWGAVWLAALFFGAATISTMMAMVWAGVRGLELVAVDRLERYLHAAAGLTVLLCGLAIQLLGA
jgi:nickel/cobalt transporter (NicO) family protein